MAATMSMSIATMSMAMMNPKLTPNSKPAVSLFSLPKGLAAATQNATVSSCVAGTALAGAFFSSLGNCDAALAAQQIAEIADGDNRGLALLLPLVPAIAWVLFNILQPALNQINRMRSTKGLIVGLGLGLGGLAATGPEASASEMAVIADAAAGGDNRGQLLLFVVAPAILWVLYNILQPALNQINRMRSE